MWANSERGMDGMGGGMLSWLTHPPTQSSALEEMEEGVEHLAETVSEQVDDASETLGKAMKRVAAKATETAREVADTVAETAGEVADAVAETADDAADAVASAPEVVETVAAALVDGEVAGSDSDALAEPEKKLLATLEPGSGGLSMKQLQQATGGTPYATRQRLNRLIRAGKVQRKGKGMRTRYHLVE